LASWAKYEQECGMLISISMIVVSSQLAVAVADRVPAFDINRSCRLDLAATAGLSVDQTTKSCVNDEKRARQQLASQWSKFSAPSKAECVPQESIGGTPSYVSLLTCLQLGQWAR
jgi:hypothetical protein